MRRIQSKPLHHSFRHTHRLSLLLIVCVSFLFVEVAHACSCRFEEEKGFIHGSGRLPSNARGVLFRVSHLEGMISYQPGFSIVNILPSQFDANSFVIREAGKDTPLPAVIEKVTPTNSEGSARRIYFTDDRDLQVCLQTMDHGSCQATQVKLDKEDWRQTLISSGRLRDVTDLASGSGELFRVRPAKGFVEGLTYEIEHKALRKVEPIKASEGSFFIGDDRSNKITIEIGAPLNISDKDQFAINRLGALKRESISLSASGSCSESRSGTSQMLRYELPAQYEAYRTSMVYFTETKIPNVNDGENRFFPYIYQTNLCQRATYGGSNVGVSQEKVYRLCGFSQQGELVSAPTIVRGKVGFLEMGDALFETPELMVNFDNPELGSCSAVGSLIEAMNSGNAETIAERTCSLAGVSREIIDNQLQSILRLMTKLSENNNSTTRKCAIDSALAIYRRLSSLQTRPNQDPLLGSQVDRSLPTQKSGSDFDIAISLLRIINTSIFAEEEAIQKQYDHSFTELVSILWSAQNHLKLSATEKQKLLKQTLNIIEKILQNKKTDTHRYFVVRDVLNHLGPVARPYISDLLKYLIEPSMQRYGLISSLVRVAPNDPRVFDAAVNYFKTSHELDAADILIAAGKEKTSVVLDLLLSALREGDDEKSRVIKAVGSMGNEAMSAKPLLYLVARTTKHPRTREFALLAVVDIDKQDPTIAQEIIQELEHPLTDNSEQTFAGNIEMRSCNYIYALGKIGKNAQIALPALKEIMQEKLTRTQRYALEFAFRNMQLEETELRSLLATLNNTQLVY